MTAIPAALPPVKSRRERWLHLAIRIAPAAFLLIVGGWLRIFDLGYRSLWLDEVFTAQVVRLPDLGSVLDYLVRDPGSAPLHYVVTWLLRPLGAGETAIRLPYAIVGLLAVIAVYALAARLYGRASGVVAGLLMAILPFAIYYSQESRPYAFLMLLSALVMLAAYRASTRGRAIDWVSLGAAGALDLYTGYLAIAVLAAAYGYVGLVLAGNVLAGWRAARFREAVAASARAGGMAIVSGAIIGTAFLPWFGHLETFLADRDVAFGRAAGGHRPTLDEARVLLDQLDFHGIMVWLLIVGITWAVIGLARGGWKESLVPLTWFFIPLLGFALGAGGGIVTIWPRYFGAIYPAGVLLAAMGMDGLARGAMFVVGLALESKPAVPDRDPSPRSTTSRFTARAVARSAVLACLCGLVAVDALPADAAAYTRPKGSDYRDAVDTMLAADPGRPVVLVVGDDPDWTVSGLGYYSWVRGSRLAVLDALKLNADDLRSLQQATSVWGAALNSTGLPDPAAGGFGVGLFADISLLRPPHSEAAPTDQARSILDWAASFEPQMAAPTRLISILQGHGTAGPELLPAPSASQAEGGPVPNDRWILQPGTSLSPDAGAFLLDPGGRSVNVYLSTTNLQPGAAYLISFSCQASRLVGSEHVFVVANGPSGQTAFPDGAGYQCRASSDGDEGIFAFTMPIGATSAILWLRATGTGSASYQRLSLRALH